MKKIKSILPALCTVFVLAATSCSGSGDWNKISKLSKEINYCLLIGQLDHNDSNARTYGTRSIFGTLGNPDPVAAKGNENSFNPKPNDKFGFARDCFESDEDYNAYGENAFTFSVKELEHGEQRNTSGATWDAITASETSSLWITKHSYDTWFDRNNTAHKGQSLTCIVSNNDGMAMGALMSGFWHKGMPIFGYDATADALQSIADGNLIGTVEADNASQCAAVYMLIRNVISWNNGDSKFKTIEDVLKYGFNHKEGGPVEGSFGYLPKCMNDKYSAGEYSLMSISQTVTQKDNGGVSDITNFVKKNPDTGKYEALSSVERFNLDNKKSETETYIHSDPSSKPIKIYQSYYSNTDANIMGSVKPIFDHLRSANLMNVSGDSYESYGNGNDEKSSLEELEIQLNKKDNPYDAFVLNIVKQDSAKTYLDKIYDAYKDLPGNDGKTVKQPVIFFNRQPLDTNIMKEYVENGKFKFVYYVGMDAVQGGIAQGEMVRQYLCNKFVEAQKGGK